MAFGNISTLYIPTAANAGASQWGTDVRKLLDSADAGSDATTKTNHGTSTSASLKTCDPYTTATADLDQSLYGWAITPSDMNSVSGAKRFYPAGNHTLTVRMGHNGSTGVTATLSVSVYRVGNAAGGRVRTLLAGDANTFDLPALSGEVTATCTVALGEVVFEPDETIQYSCEITCGGIVVVGRIVTFYTGTQTSVVTSISTPTLRVLADTTGTATGTGAATGTSGKVLGTIGASAGAGTASGTGASRADTTGTAAGSGTVAGAGSSVAGTTGTSTGSGTATGVLGATGAMAGSASGSSTVTGVLGATGGMTGSSSGSGTASGVLGATAATTGTSAGTVVVTGLGSSVAGTVGTAAGVGSAAGLSSIVLGTVGTVSIGTGGGGTTIIGRPTTLRRLGGFVSLNPGQIVPVEPIWYDSDGNLVSPVGAVVSFRDFSTGSARYWTGAAWTSSPTTLATTAGRYLLTVPSAWLGLVVAVTASLAGQPDLPDAYTIDDTTTSRSTAAALATVQADADDLQASLATVLARLDVATSTRASAADIASALSDLTTLLGRLTALRATGLDNLDATVSSRASGTAVATVQTDTDDLQTSLATVLSRLDVAVSTRASAADLASVIADLTTVLSRVDVATSTRASAAAVAALGSPAQAAALTSAVAALLVEIDTRATPADVQVTVSQGYGGRTA